MRLLGNHAIVRRKPPKAPPSNHITGMDPVTNQSTPEAKIALFRSLFRGRDDVYPRRFESRKTGKAGYAPACSNEWIHGVCEKPRIKCTDCPNRKFLPASAEVVRWHLSGSDGAGNPFVMGIYPMLLDETCFFLAVDFDGDAWRDDVGAYMHTCESFEIPAALERSRSGNGGHVWLFFREAIPAVLARKLASHILTETMDARGTMSLQSYDRFFPNQDTLPKGGFGNLIALPLQHRPRAAGNSVFVDTAFDAIADQWQFLSKLQTIPRQQVEALVETASRSGTLIGVRAVPSDSHSDAPWDAPPSRRHDNKITGPLPKALHLVLADQLYIAKGSLSPSLHNQLVRIAAFQNPEFYRAQAMRLPTYDKPRIVACAEELPEHIGLPRGCLDEVRELLAKLDIKVTFEDKRTTGSPIDLTFQGQLRPEQTTATEALLSHDFGVLSATTGFGKTVIAAKLIAQRGVNTLVLVHRQQLMEQWVERSR